MNSVKIDIQDAIDWIVASMVIFHDEPVERQENMEKLLDLLQFCIQENIEQSGSALQVDAFKADPNDPNRMQLNIKRLEVFYAAPLKSKRRQIN